MTPVLHPPFSIFQPSGKAGLKRILWNRALYFKVAKKRGRAEHVIKCSSIECHSEHFSPSPNSGGSYPPFYSLPTNKLNDGWDKKTHDPITYQSPGQCTLLHSVSIFYYISHSDSLLITNIEFRAFNISKAEMMTMNIEGMYNPFKLTIQFSAISNFQLGLS